MRCFFLYWDYIKKLLCILIPCWFLLAVNVWSTNQWLVVDTFKFVTLFSNLRTNVQVATLYCFRYKLLIRFDIHKMSDITILSRNTGQPENFSKFILVAIKFQLSTNMNKVAISMLMCFPLGLLVLFLLHNWNIGCLLGRDPCLVRVLSLLGPQCDHGLSNVIKLEQTRSIVVSIINFIV